MQIVEELRVQLLQISKSLTNEKGRDLGHRRAELNMVGVCLESRWLSIRNDQQSGDENLALKIGTVQDTDEIWASGPLKMTFLR